MIFSRQAAYGRLPDYTGMEGYAMRIMLVNDDGYRAQGIRALARALMDAGHEAVICAPDCERSGASHSFSFGRCVNVREFSEDGLSGYAIGGTPADSAALGLQLVENVDMVISGINHGTNLGAACIYSGTVGGAMEASMLGVPAVAVSIGDYNNGFLFEECAKVVVRALDWFAARPLARGEVYNLNVPNLPYEKIRGFRNAKLTKSMVCNSKYEKRIGENGETQYLTRFGGFIDDGDMTSDHMLLKEGWATITPLTWDMIAQRSVDDPEIEL